MARLLSNTVLKNLIRSSHSSKQMVMSTSAFRQYMCYSTWLSDDSGGHGDFHVDNSSASSTSYPTSISADSDTHEDFQPTTKSSGITWQDAVDQDVKENPVLIYMKGLPDDPKCGFSALAVKVLQQYNVPISARDILGDPKLKESVKAYSNWPTFPQIFIKGEFVGGSDIVLTMHQKGELKDLLADIIRGSSQDSA